MTWRRAVAGSQWWLIRRWMYPQPTVLKSTVAVSSPGTARRVPSAAPSARIRSNGSANTSVSSAPGPGLWKTSPPARNIPASSGRWSSAASQTASSAACSRWAAGAVAVSAGQIAARNVSAARRVSAATS